MVHLVVPFKVTANSAFKLDFYAQVQDLSYLLEHLNTSHRTKRYSALNAAICDLIEDFGLVSFETLAVEVVACRERLTYRTNDRWRVCWKRSTVLEDTCLEARKHLQIISGHPLRAQDGHLISTFSTSRNVGSITKMNTTKKNENNGENRELSLGK